MPDAIRVLVVSGERDVAAVAAQRLGTHRPAPIVHWLKDPAVALPRVCGGDIDVVIIQPSSLGVPAHDVENFVDQLHGVRPQLQIMLIGDAGESPHADGPAPAILRPECWATDLQQIVGSGARVQAGVSSKPRDNPQWIGFLGAKGGVGTTTVALNVACVLAETAGETVLAELGATTDTLGLHVRIASSAPELSPPPPALTHQLWQVAGFPRLRLGLARDSPYGGEDIVAGATAASTALGRSTRYILLDLGSQITELVGRILPRLDLLGLVLGREPVSVECAKQMLSRIQDPGRSPLPATEAVIVNASALACPLDLQEVQNEIGIATLGVIAPDADLCCAAQKARVPGITLGPASPFAQSLTAMARNIAAPARRMDKRTFDGPASGEHFRMRLRS